MKNSKSPGYHLKGIFTSGLMIMLLLIAISCETKLPKNSFAAQVERGKVNFEKYCAGCHGNDATGMGIVRDSLTKPPADLTTIQLRSGKDKFPTNDVAVMIDGRQLVEAHGTREMPVWGNVFVSDENPDDKELKGKMGELVAYLMSIQKVGD